MSNFYITTAIPYVNSEPHIGFGMEIVMADVLARYMRNSKTPTLFSTGTDEHGGKIAESAQALNLEPQQFVDQVSQQFRDLTRILNISNDRFIRTTEPAHEQRSQLVWRNLSQFIYKGQYEGWYCTGDEEFFSEQTVKANNGICPDHNRPYEKLKEENYFFKLSYFTTKIKQSIETDAFKVIPDTRKNEILSVVNSGLEDISISRPKDKIAWGIPVPGDDNQVMYVWFEALLNYITVLGYPEHKDFINFWPANVQVIGKGILRFHAAIWPAILMGLGLKLPNTLFVHGYILVDGKKMSKSLKNVVLPKDIVAKYGADTFRYFFLRHIPSYGDGDFSWKRLEAVYESELADQLGNTVNRAAAMITKYSEGVIGEIPAPEHDIGPFEAALTSCRFDKALEVIWDQIKGLNQYIEETKPWEIANPKNKANDPEHLKEVLAYITANILEVADLLYPFMPDTSAKIINTFGSGVLKPLPGPLFPKHEPEKPSPLA